MKAESVKLQPLFSKGIRYIVPTFQRPYVWNEEEHWQILWEDLRQIVEELRERRSVASESELKSNKPRESTPPHFLGALVLDQLATPAGKLEARRVIDGQQRLTTLQVLLSALRSVALDLEISTQASLVEKLIFNDSDLFEEDHHRVKVWPIEPDRKAFQEVMGTPEAPASDVENTGSHAIRECYVFLRRELYDWVTEGSEPIEKRIEAIVDTLWYLIRLVVIDLEEQDDPQVIFETLNARGTPLLAADLIKNFIFREIEEQGGSVEGLHQEYWAKFDEKDWRTEVSQGRLERPRIDVFVMHWLTMRTARRIRAEQLFPEFRRYLKRGNIAVQEVLQDISFYADVYRKFSEPHSESREGLFFKRLEILDTTTPYPILLWLYGNDGINADRRIRAVEAIESWLMRRMLCRLTSKNYNRIFLDLLEKLKNTDARPVDEVTVEFFSEKEGSSDLWPDDERLVEAMKAQRYWAQINQRRLRMFFRALERELRSTGYSEGLGITESLHIEHILPRDWAHNWELPREEPEEVERIRRDEIKHRVGNLTVLTSKLNPSVSNAAWRKKRDAIDDHTVLLLNRELLKRWGEEWNEDTIFERAERLAELAGRVWPGPEDSYWGS